MRNFLTLFRGCLAHAIGALAIAAFGTFSDAYAHDGIGTPLIAEVGVPLQIDPTDGLRAEPSEQLRAEWSWDTVPSGSTATFDDPDAYRPSFTPDLSGTYVALATFYDIADVGSTTPRHTVRVEVGTGNLAPVALIRARGMPNGSTPLVLDGSASYDVNGDGLSYLWSIEATPNMASIAAFADPAAPITNLRLDYDGDYTIGLTVEDEHSATSTKALFSFKYLSTYGGTTDVFRYSFDQTLTSTPGVGNLFELGDLSSDPPQDFAIFGFRLDDGTEPFPDTVEFDFNSVSWSLSTPLSLLDLVEYLDTQAHWSALTRISPDPDFTDLTFIFGEGRGSLTLKGVLGVALPRQDVIDAGAEFYEGSGSRNIPPVASLRFDQLPAGVSQTVWLDPYATTDIDTRVLNGVNMGLAIAPPGSTAFLDWGPQQTRTLSPPTAGDHVVTLRAHDWAANGITSILIPVGSDPDVRPVGGIEPVISAPLDIALRLDATQSYDLDGDLLSYAWALLSRPGGSNSTILDAVSPQTQLTPDVPGLYIVQLQVTGGGKTSVPQTWPILVETPLPVADAGADQLPNFAGEAVLDSSASTPSISARMWQAIGIKTGEGTTVVAEPTETETEVVLPRLQATFGETLKVSPVYHFHRTVEDGYCSYDIRQPGDMPGASPSEPVALALTAHGEIWGPLGLMQVWEIENEGEYTREITLIDASSTVHGTYIVPGEVSIFVATADIGALELSVEVDSTVEASGFGQNSPFTLWQLICTGPGSDVFQIVAANGAGYSLPETVFAGDANIRPVVTRPADQAVDLGVPVILTGTDYSHDANGGGLNHAWALIHRPDGSTATLDGTPINTIHTGAQAEFTPDVAGLYLVQLVASDAEFLSVPAVIVIQAGGHTPNRPPVLEPLDPLYTVEAGLTLTVPLIGSDPDGDPISYFVSPLPLPAGFSLDANSGEIRFSPLTAQIGSYTFAVGVSDGALTDQATLDIAVVAATALDTGVSGIVRDAATNAPLAGIPVRLRDAALSTTTDVNGEFTFTGLSAGPDQVLVEPSAVGGPGGYAAMVRAIRIVEDQEIPLDPAFLLTPLGDGCATVVSGVPTVLTGSTNGVTVTIPADSINASGGGAYTGSVCLGSLPELFAVEGLPQDTQACRVYALDAPGGVFTQGISVVAPNVDGLPETTILDYWQVNPLNGLFRPAATAGVDTGATTVSSSVASFRNSTLFAFLPRAPQLVSSADQPTGNRSYSVFDGNMSETYRLPTYRAFNRDQRVGLTYNSETANPTVIVAGDVTIRATDSLPVGLTTRIDVGGLSISGDAAWTPREGLDNSTPALVGEAVTMRQSLAVDALGLASGRYGYNFIARAQYDCSTVAAVHAADIYIRNDSDSPYGKGWVIEGLQELVIGDDGRVSIFDDKGVSTFNPQPTLTEFDGDPLVFPSVGTQGVAIADLDGDGLLDVAYGSSGTGSARIVRGLGGRDMVYDREFVFAAPNAVPPSGVYTPNLIGLVAGELGSEGIPDLGYGLQVEDRVGYLLNDGFGNLSDVTILATSMTATDVAIIDIDGDGYEDFLFLNRTSLVDNEVQVAYGSPTGLAAPVRANYRSQLGVPVQFEIGDIDGNGQLDIAWRLTSGATTFLFQTSPRTFVTVVSSPAIGPSPINRLGKYFQLADFNGDGKLDIVWSGTDNITVYLNANTTGRTFLAGVGLARPPAATTAMYVHAVDANGDGLPDIVASGGDTVVVYVSNGDGTFQPFEEGLVDYSIEDMAFADIDGDGSLDLVSAQRFSTSVHFSRPSASGKFVAGAGEFSELTALPGGGWERRYKDGNVVVFDEDGRQTAEVDPQGNTRAFAYDVDGRLSTVTDQVGGVTSFAYGLLGRLDTITYPDGRVTSFTYDDDAGALASITEPSPESGTVSFGYDANGRLISTTNQNGNTTGYSYDATGRLSGSSLPDGSSIRTQIGASIGLVDAFGSAAAVPLKFVKPEDRITVAVDRKGGETEIEVNEFGSIVRTTDPIGRVTLLEREADDLVTAITRPNESLPGGTRRDEMTYDSRGNILTLIEAEGTSLERTTRYEYESVFSKVTLKIDPGNYETEYEYDPTGLVLKIEDAEGGQRLFTYTAEGQLESSIDKNGNETAYGYDIRGNLDEIVYADGSVTTLAYDTRGYPTVRAEASGTPMERQIHRTYDSLGRVLTVFVTDSGGIPAQGEISITYDPAGNPIGRIDQTGIATSAEYDALERLVEMTDPIEGTIHRTYNLFGEMAEFTNGAGETFAYSFDSVGRLTLEIDPENYERAFSYDSRDNIVSVVDARNGETTFAFDGLNRLVERTNPLDLSILRTYDSRGNVLSLTREDSSVETASYDGLSRRIQVTTPDNTLSYSYDFFGNLREAADDDSRITFLYDDRNRLASATTDGTVGPQPAVTLTYTYDLLGRRVSMADSLGGSTVYEWNDQGWLVGLETPWGSEFAFAYDDAGRRTGLTSSDGRLSTLGYTNGLLTEMTHVLGATTLTDLTFQYTPDGKIHETIDGLDPAKSLAFTYDALNRLVGADKGAPAVPIESYSYDGEGNRLSSHLSTFYSSNVNNQLTEDDDYTYAYDDRGNRIRRTAKVGGAVETYTYDSQNRLIGYDTSSTAATYAYDAFDRRIAKTVNGSTEAWIYDATNLSDSTTYNAVLQFISGTLHRRWVFGSRIDEPISYEEYSSGTTPGTGAVVELLSNRLGSVIAAIMVSTGAVAAEYDYDSYGSRTQIGALTQPYGFTGRVHDAESDLIYVRARSYDPRTGVFVQADPIGFRAGQENLYTYVANNPLNFTDPSGLFLDTKKAGQLEYQMGLQRDQAIRLAALPKTISAVGMLAAYIAAVAEFSAGGIDSPDSSDDDEPSPEPQPQASSSGGGGYHIHHCFPSAYGGSNDASNKVRISVKRHQELHRLMRKYFQNFIHISTRKSMDYGYRWKGSDIVRVFGEELVNATIRQFYDDYADLFPECVGK